MFSGSLQRITGIIRAECCESNRGRVTESALANSRKAAGRWARSASSSQNSEEGPVRPRMSIGSGVPVKADSAGVATDPQIKPPSQKVRVRSASI